MNGICQVALDRVDHNLHARLNPQKPIIQKKGEITVRYANVTGVEELYPNECAYPIGKLIIRENHQCNEVESSSRWRNAQGHIKLPYLTLQAEIFCSGRAAHKQACRSIKHTQLQSQTRMQVRLMAQIP